MSQAIFRALVDKMFPPDKLEAHLEKVLAPQVFRNYQQNYPHYIKASIQVDFTSNGDGMRLSISHQLLSTLIVVNLKCVESCCAMVFLHGFYIDPGDRLTEAQIEEILDTFLQQAEGWSHFSSRRMIVNMVEHSRGIYDPLAIPEPLENPKMHYPKLLTYLKKKAKRINTMLMPNANTGNIIHHMEVLL